MIQTHSKPANTQTPSDTHEKKPFPIKTIRNYALAAGGLGALVYFGNKDHLEHGVQHALLGGVVSSLVLNPFMALMGNNSDASHNHNHGHNHGTEENHTKSNAVTNFATEVAHHLLIGNVIDVFFNKKHHHH